MKKLMLVCLMLVATIAAKAQFEHGRVIVNPAVSGFDFSYSKGEKVNLGIGAQVGSFIASDIALLVEAGGDWSKPVDTYTIGTGLRFYFDTSGVFLGGGIDLGHLRYKGGKRNTDWGPMVEIGYAYFVSETVAIQPVIYYKWRLNDRDRSNFGLKIGLGIYL